MGFGLIGVAALCLALWLLRGLVSANPKQLAQGLRMLAGSVGLGIGAPLLLTGRIWAGLVLCAAGAWGMGWFSALSRKGSEADQNRGASGGAEHADADGHARHAGPARMGAMSKQEAYQILGLDPGAGHDAVRAAHRTLIKKLHPDAGGVSALAAKVNEAKDVLLK